MKKKIFVVFIIILFASAIYLDISHDYPEKFKIESLSATMYKVDGIDKNNCYVLSVVTQKDSIMPDNIYLLGIHFNLEYLSLHREHLWESNSALDGFEGHIDTINKMIIQFPNGQILDPNYINNASPYKNFYVEGLNTIEGHHISQNGCYIAQTPGDMQSFVSLYNSNMLTPNFVSFMHDTYLFKVSSTEVFSMLDGNGIIFMDFTDGRKIEQRIDSNN